MVRIRFYKSLILTVCNVTKDILWDITNGSNNSYPQVHFLLVINYPCPSLGFQPLDLNI